MKIQDFSSKKHGGSISKRVLDFSANTSPLGMHPASQRALAAASLDSASIVAYPDSASSELTALLGRFWSFPADSIICGNGASELIYLISDAFLVENAAILEPAFSEYERSVLKKNPDAKIERLALDYSDEKAFLDFSLSPGTSLVFAASPSNPLGKVLSLEEIFSVEKACERAGCVFVLDSCFCQFSERANSVLEKLIERKDDFPNLIVLNAFTKFYGMAGLRLGYALCFSKALCARLQSLSQPWPVSAVAQSCGEAVLKSELCGTDFSPASSWTRRMRALVEAERKRFESFFEKWGIEFEKSESNFVSFKFTFPKGSFSLAENSVTEFSSVLSDDEKFEGIQIRSCVDFFSLGGEWHRIAVKSPIENSVLLRLFEGILSEKKAFGEVGVQKARCVMVQGTMSNSGKSLLVAALCRIFRNDGFRVAPFKSQNMALNSGVTADGREMGRAQIMQAEAAKILPDVRMNPVLLKPNSDSGSQVIVNGEILCNMSARDYFSYRKSLLPKIKEAYDSLAEENDIIVIEGAGSPAEINLRENDIVNMGLAELVDAPVVIVGDIDRGGVFASLYGTFALLGESERKRVKGFVINKFRGDVSLLQNGLSMLNDLTGREVLGVVPFIRGLKIDDEDSLSAALSNSSQPGKKSAALLKVSVVRLPYISNFTDLDSFSRLPFVDVEFFDSADTFDSSSDLLVVPGSKNTIASMEFLDSTGLSGLIRKFAVERPVVGICGGFQLLGKSLDDSSGNEDASAKKMEGLSLLPLGTFFTSRKTRVQVSEKLPSIEGFFSFLSGKKVRGYEIHQGETFFAGGEEKNVRIFAKGNVLGTYIHGFFDSADVVDSILEVLASKKNVELPEIDGAEDVKEREFDRLERVVRESVDLKKLYAILGIDIEKIDLGE